MNIFRTLLSKALLAIPAISALAGPAQALPVPAPDAPSMVMEASANCNAVGQRQASQAGGQLARATLETRGGQQVCVLVILMPPAQDGQRPRRTEVVVPAG